MDSKTFACKDTGDESRSVEAISFTEMAQVATRAGTCPEEAGLRERMILKNKAARKIRFSTIEHPLVTVAGSNFQIHGMSKQWPLGPLDYSPSLLF